MHDALARQIAGLSLWAAFVVVQADVSELDAPLREDPPVQAASRRGLLLQIAAHRLCTVTPADTLSVVRPFALAKGMNLTSGDLVGAPRSHLGADRDDLVTADPLESMKRPEEPRM
jgi:hypothetical protein